MMHRCLLRPIAAGLLLMSGPLSAQEDNWLNETIWLTVGEEYGLSQQLSAKVFADEAVRAEIRRIGVSPACAEIASFTEEAVAEESDVYRALIVAQILAEYPTVPNRQESLNLTPNMMPFQRHLNRLEASHPEMFSRMYRAVTEKLVPQLQDMPNASGDWRGPVSDWNFETAIGAIWRSSCLVANHAEPSVSKRTFDGFYQQRGGS